MADYDLELVQNSTYERAFAWKKNGEIQALTDYSHHAQIRQREDTDSALLLDLGPHMTLVEGDTKIRLRIPGGVLAALNPRDFKRAAWDLVLVSVSDPTDRVTLLEGAVSLDPGTTVVPG